MKRNWFKMQVSDNKLRIDIYSEIGFWGMDAERFMDQLNYNSFDELEIHINSMGGSVFEAVAIYNNLKALGKKSVCYIDGICASAGTVIALGCDEIIMPNNAFFMIHNPSVFSEGESNQLRKQADLLDKITNSIINIYKSKTGLEEEVIRGLMDAETWLMATEAKEYGFIDSIVEDVSVGEETISNLINIDLKHSIPVGALMFLKTQPQNTRGKQPMAKEKTEVNVGKDNIKSEIKGYQAENLRMKAELDALKAEAKKADIELKVYKLGVNNKVTDGQKGIIQKMYETSTNWEVLDTFFETTKSQIDETVNLTIVPDAKKKDATDDTVKSEIEMKMEKYNELMKQGFSEQKATKMAFGKIL